MAAFGPDRPVVEGLAKIVIRYNQFAKTQNQAAGTENPCPN